MLSAKCQKRKRAVAIVAGVIFLLSFSFSPSAFAEDADVSQNETVIAQEQEGEITEGEEGQEKSSEPAPEKETKEDKKSEITSEEETQDTQRSGTGPYRIEGKGYFANLYEANIAAEDGDTIYVVEDNTWNGGGRIIVMNKKVTLKPEGGPKSITLYGSMISLKNGGDVTLGGEDRLSITGSVYTAVYVQGGKLRLTNVDLTAPFRTVWVNAGTVEYIKDTKITATDSDGTALIVDGGNSGSATVQLIENSSFYSEGTKGKGIVCINGYIKMITGCNIVGGKTYGFGGMVSTGAGLYILPGSQVDKVVGTTCKGPWGMVIFSGDTEIDGSTFIGESSGVPGTGLQVEWQGKATINNSSFKGNTYGISNYGQIAHIKNTSVIMGEKGTGISNNMKIGSIENCVIKTTANPGIENRGHYGVSVYNISPGDGTIGVIKGTSISSQNSDAIINRTRSFVIPGRGIIGSIESGYFDGGKNGIRNNSSIGEIKGGAFIGRSGAALYVGEGETEDATVGKIVIKNPGDAYFSGSTYAIDLEESSSVGVITGHGIYRGGTKGTVNIENDRRAPSLPLERLVDPSLDLTETGDNPGNGRYYAQDGSTYFAGNPFLVGIPRGYHMSKMDTSVKETKQGIVPEERYHFLVKDNTIVYVGNGENHPETTGKAAKNIDIDNAVFVASETPVATVKANGDGFRFEEDGYALSSWNTKPDGSGTSYVPGDTYQFEPETELVLYAQWEKKPVPPEVTPPGDNETPDPLTPGKVTKAKSPNTKDLFPRYIVFMFVVSGVALLLLFFCNRDRRIKK